MHCGSVIALPYWTARILHRNHAIPISPTDICIIIPQKARPVAQTRAIIQQRDCALLQNPQIGNPLRNRLLTLKPPTYANNNGNPLVSKLASHNPHRWKPSYEFQPVLAITRSHMSPVPPSVRHTKCPTSNPFSSSLPPRQPLA